MHTGEIVDTTEYKRKYPKKKHMSKVDFIDVETRNVIRMKKVTPSVIKFSHRYNY